MATKQSMFLPLLMEQFGVGERETIPIAQLIFIVRLQIVNNNKMWISMNDWNHIFRVNSPWIYLIIIWHNFTYKIQTIRNSTMWFQFVNKTIKNKHLAILTFSLKMSTKLKRRGQGPAETLVVNTLGWVGSVSDRGSIS